HIPLDDRLSVTLTQQWNYRLQDVGHLSFWNPASAITMLTSAGLEPLGCLLSPGFLAPSGRVRLSQNKSCFLFVGWPGGSILDSRRQRLAESA
ncbi:MAG: hypothetical protein NTX02_07305, partial [Planctomycetia bacterium]|nr:hypothetical protein [Planctomycetia bacterium]